MDCSQNDGNDADPTISTLFFCSLAASKPDTSIAGYVKCCERKVVFMLMLRSTVNPCLDEAPKSLRPLPPDLWSKNWASRRFHRKPYGSIVSECSELLVARFIELTNCQVDSSANKKSMNYKVTTNWRRNSKLYSDHRIFYPCSTALISASASLPFSLFLFIVNRFISEGVFFFLL